MELHKILYVCYVLYAGRTEKALFHEHFEAWKYGPVLPTLYNKLRCFGAKRVLDIFGVDILDVSDPVEKEGYDLIKETGLYLSKYTAGQLVNLTHQAEGAWKKKYRQGVKYIPITLEDSIQEYNSLYR